MFKRIFVPLFLIFPWISQGAESVSITFAPPPTEGRITLGVFNSDGSCIRVLKNQADFSEFNREVNGLGILWDGNTDTGTPAPAGTYEVRGVVAAEMPVKSMTLESNDWPAATPGQRVNGIRAAVINPGGGWILLAGLMDGGSALLRIKDAATEVFPLDFNATMLAADSGQLLVADANHVALFDSDLKPVGALEEKGIQSIAAADGRIYLATEKEIVINDATGSTTLPLPPGKEAAREPSHLSLAAKANRLWMARDGKVMVNKNGEWKDFSPESLDYAVSVLSTADGTLWVVDHGAEFPGIKQFSVTGEFLRYLAPEENGPWPLAVATPPPGDPGLLLVEASTTIQTARVLTMESVKKADSDEQAESLWRIDWQKSIERNPTPPTPTGLVITLPPNALEGNAAATVELVAVVRDGFCVLQTADGLPLLQLAPTSMDASASVEAGSNREEACIRLEDSAGTATFTIGNVRRMLLFHAGTYEWAGGEKERHE